MQDTVAKSFKFEIRKFRLIVMKYDRFQKAQKARCNNVLEYFLARGWAITKSVPILFQLLPGPDCL